MKHEVEKQLVLQILVNNEGWNNNVKRQTEEGRLWRCGVSEVIVRDYILTRQ